MPRYIQFCAVFAALLFATVTVDAQNSPAKNQPKIDYDKLADALLEDRRFSRRLIRRLVRQLAGGSADNGDGDGPDTGDIAVKIDQNGDNWCTVLGKKLQICWGFQTAVRDRRNPHTQTFNVTFARPFRAPPAVSNAINAQGSGWNYQVYQSNVTASGYRGRLNESRARPGRDTTTFHYTAIGLAQSQYGS